MQPTTSQIAKVLRIFPLLLLLLVVGCQSSRNAGRVQTEDATWNLFEGARIGLVERVIVDQQLVVISLRQSTHRNPPRDGVPLETRSLQYQLTSTLEAGPHPTNRYLTARITSGTPQLGDLVLLAPANP